MDIRTLKDADHRLSSGRSMRFRGDKTYLGVAKTVADDLIARKCARVATKDEIAAAKETQANKGAK